MEPGTYVQHVADHEIRGWVVRPDKGGEQWRRETFGSGFTYMDTVSVLIPGLYEVRTFRSDMVEPVPASG